MKIPLICPCCQKRLTDTEDTVISEVEPVFRLKGREVKAWVPDYYVKCWNCKNEIAIKKVG